MRPPLSAPPVRNATVPCPWSVPSVPLMRAVRPNSVMTATTVSCHASPILVSMAASAPSSAPRRLASWPAAAPPLISVSPPTKPQRGHGADAKRAAAAQINLAIRGQRHQRAIEPAGINGAGPRDAAFEHVLAVEMRALAIGRRGGVNDRCLLRLVKPMQVRHRGIEREERIERQRRCLAVEHQRAIAAQADPVGVADRRHRAEAIERAPEHDDEQARIAALGACALGHLRPRKQRAGADQRLAAAMQMAAKSHGHLPLNFAAMNKSARAPSRVSAAPTRRLPT